MKFSMSFQPALWRVLNNGYSAAAAVKDFHAGLTVAIVALPLAMAFAIASGLPPLAGLTAAIVGGFLVSALGGSRVQIGGPAGAFIVVVYAIVERYGIAHLLLCTLLSGIILFLLGWARLGSLIRLIPVPVVIGFTNGIAVLIALSQIKDFLGLHVYAMPGHFIGQIQALWSAHNSFNGYAVILAMLALLVLFVWPKAFSTHAPSGWKKVLARIPAPLVVLILGSLIVYGMQWPVETIGSRFGHLPAGLPKLSWPIPPTLDLSALVAPTLTLAFLGAIESLLCARVADTLSRDRHDPNQELMAQGIANFAVPWLGGLPVTGTMARTVTNIRAGAISPIAGITHALLLLVLLSVAAPWAEQVPLAVLAALLMFVAWNMGEWKEFARLKAFSVHYRVIVLSTFVLTVIVDLTVAVQVGLALACLFFIMRVASLTRIEAIVNGRWPADTLVYRIHGSLFFASAAKLEVLIDEARTARVLALDLSKVINIDTTGIEALQTLHQRLQERGTALFLCELNTQAQSLLKRSGLADKLGAQQILNTWPELEQQLMHRASSTPSSGQ